MKATAIWRGVFGLVSRLSIGEPLAFRTLQDAISAEVVCHAQFGAVVRPEIELGQITVNVLLANVLIDANQPTLKHAEIAFQRVRMDRTFLALADIRLGMIDRFMVRR